MRAGVYLETLAMITVPPNHPLYRAVELANAELNGAIDAAAGGNSGRARVCARRAVGLFLQSIGPAIGGDVGDNAMANLRFVERAEHLPPETRAAAERLAGGARSLAEGSPVSADPLADAAHIINYFVRQASM